MDPMKDAALTAPVHAGPAPQGAGAATLDALPWRNTFAHLPPVFYARLDPAPLPQPTLIDVSEGAAVRIGLDPACIDHAALRDQLAGQRPVAGSAPLASVYAGHQFGVYVPQLGDGRALLLGGVETPAGDTWELQLKGSGRTPYSRMADGRAVLRSSIREYLCSEAMAALGVPTTRALALVGSDQPVIRETVETAAVVMRLAPSFVRFGHFEFFYHRSQHEALRQLADYVIDGFFPACRLAPNPYLALLEDVARRTAVMVAQWQGVGFCHGVMNTDNLSILGLTIDYGPFGFIDAFDANHICNHSDDTGRYAYNQQPQVAYWNLHCLGQALIPLTVDVDATRAALQVFEDTFAVAMDDLFHAKLGLATKRDGDETLIERLIVLLHENGADWTVFWRRLADLNAAAPIDTGANAAVRDLFVDRAAFDAWAAGYRARLAAEAGVDTERAARMRRVNPKFVLRNHLAEVAIRAARGDNGKPDFSELKRLLQVLRRPYDEQPEAEAYAQVPPDWAGALHLSCSS
jgi:serine/tyrosine/threonine adenylyltransferase